MVYTFVSISKLLESSLSKLYFKEGYHLGKSTKVQLRQQGLFPLSLISHCAKSAMNHQTTSTLMVPYIDIETVHMIVVGDGMIPSWKFKIHKSTARGGLGIPTDRNQRS